MVDQESVVYGCIKDLSGADIDQDDGIDRREVNRKALGALPSLEDWPLISREMFSTPPIAAAGTSFQTEVFHFGASYQAIEYEWETWLAKFEEMLRGMYWIAAVVHLETELHGTHTFTWEANGMCHVPGVDDNLSMRCEWSREGGIL